MSPESGTFVNARRLLMTMTFARPCGAPWRVPPTFFCKDVIAEGLFLPFRKDIIPWGLNLSIAQESDSKTVMQSNGLQGEGRVVLQSF